MEAAVVKGVVGYCAWLILVTESIVARPLQYDIANYWDRRSGLSGRLKFINCNNGFSLA